MSARVSYDTDGKVAGVLILDPAKDPLAVRTPAAPGGH
jgi:hypothetical protein